MNQSNSQIWDEHYKRDKSRLLYPDENLVRILSGVEAKGEALDHGAGSGRHSVLLKRFGYKVTACDYSKESLEIIKSIDPEINCVSIDSDSVPFSDSSFNMIVSWGVLHYNTLQSANTIIGELKRVLKKGGYIAGTVRAAQDTHLSVKNGSIGLNDLKGGQVVLYTKEMLDSLLSIFSEVKIGYMERTPLGKLEDRICHWMFRAMN